MSPAFSYPIRVYYEDTDAGGVVFYANYLKFLERARTEMLRHLGFEQDLLMTEAKIIFVVKSVQVDYIRPARFNDYLEVSAEIVQAKKISLNFKQQVYRQKTLLCQASVRIACLDIETMKPKKIPDYLLNKLI